MFLTEEENKNKDTYKKVKIIALIIAIAGVFLPFTSVRIVSGWGSDGWIHTTVMRFFYNVFTNEDISIANISVLILIRNIPYLVAIVLLFIHLVLSLQSKAKAKKSNLLIPTLVFLSVVALAHIISNLSNPALFDDIQIHRRLGFGFYVTLIGTLIPFYLNYISYQRMFRKYKI